MSEMYAYCDKLAKRISKLIDDMDETVPKRQAELQRAKKKLIQEFIIICKQNNVDYTKILEQNKLKVVYRE